MRDSIFERETHHVSLDGKLEKSISYEQFCGCSKNRHMLARTKKFHDRQLHLTDFLEPLRFEKRLIDQMKGHTFKSYLSKNQ